MNLRVLLLRNRIFGFTLIISAGIVLLGLNHYSASFYNNQVRLESSKEDFSTNLIENIVKWNILPTPNLSKLINSYCTL